jgi:hypothetical protein
MQGVALEDPRLLHRDSTKGYTHVPALALAREPEAIGEDEQTALSVRARAEFAEQRQVETRQRDRQMWSQRLRKAEQRADAKGVDIYRDEIGIRRHIMAIEKAIEEAP